MNFSVLTLFPEMIEQSLNHSITKRAQDKGIITVNSINIRDFANNKHNKVDDYPYGGGAGMVMQAPPIYDSYMSIKDKLDKNHKVIYMTPKGKTLNQDMAKKLSCEKDLVILCGHYEGVDQRVIDKIVTDEISIGDFVMTGGELGALVLIDTVSRLVDGVIGKKESYEDESFSNNLLEYPQYTRPYEFMEEKVPDVLISGNHKLIDEWRNGQSIILTKQRRPDMIEEETKYKSKKK